MELDLNLGYALPPLPPFRHDNAACIRAAFLDASGLALDLTPVAGRMHRRQRIQESLPEILRACPHPPACSARRTSENVTRAGAACACAGCASPSRGPRFPGDPSHRTGLVGRTSGSSVRGVGRAWRRSLGLCRSRVSVTSSFDCRAGSQFDHGSLESHLSFWSLLLEGIELHVRASHGSG